MKRWLAAAALVLLFEFLPTPGTELGQLHPISLLKAEVKNRKVYIETDTKQSGVGETLDAAIQNLEQTTSGHIFLDTVQTLVVRPDAVFLLSDWKRWLRPDVRVCQSEDELDMESLAEYLQEHLPAAKLTDGDSRLPILHGTEGRYILEN